MNTNSVDRQGHDNKDNPFLIQQRNQPLHESVRQALDNYLSHFKDNDPQDLYNLVLNEVEEPLMRAVMSFTKDNQSRAAITLGISRGTLRKKLKMYGLLG